MEYQPPTTPPPSQPPVLSDPPPGPGGGEKTSMGLEPNLAAALSYVCCWLTGIVFYLLEKNNSFVRFHAMQSIVTFGSLTVIFIILQVIDYLPIPGASLFSWIAQGGLLLLELIVFLILVIKAYQGERYHLPVAGEIAEKYSK